MCGEKRFKPEAVKHSLGSPPLVRGKGVLPFVPLARAGITPACAGKSTPCD